MIINANALNIPLADKTVQCAITSPPYWGLRDYGTAKWIGGDEGCEHKVGEIRTGLGMEKLGEQYRGGGKKVSIPKPMTAKNQCPHCGAIREDAQLGLEETPEQYVANMVSVFREVWRVLKDDGVCFLNLGDSYSKGMTNFPDTVHRILKSGVFFIGSTYPRTVTAKSIYILLYDKTAPDTVFEPFLAAKRVIIKNGKDDFCQIGGTLDTPVFCFIGQTLCSSIPDHADVQGLVDKVNNLGIIVTTTDLNANSSLESICAPSAKDSQAAFPIKETGEPVTKSVARRVPLLDAVSIDTVRKSTTQIDTVNKPVSFADTFDFRSSHGGNFFIREASEKQVTFMLQGGCELSILCVSHFSLLNDVGIVPYRTVLDKASRTYSANQAKQELGIPEMTKRALMEAGWICRQTIIWHKPNPMPESVTDRCVKSHEYIFLLSKSGKTLLWRNIDPDRTCPRWTWEKPEQYIFIDKESGKDKNAWRGMDYFFDHEAIKEPVAESTIKRLAQDVENQQGSYRIPGKTNGPMKAVGVRPHGIVRNRELAYDSKENSLRGNASNPDGKKESDLPLAPITRNCRSVWTVTTKPYKGAHFATFPLDLIEPMILAGSREGDIVIDPFSGTSTVGLVAHKHKRRYIGTELSLEYIQLAKKRLYGVQVSFL